MKVQPIVGTRVCLAWLPAPPPFLLLFLLLFPLLELFLVLLLLRLLHMYLLLVLFPFLLPATYLSLLSVLFFFLFLPLPLHLHMHLFPLQALNGLSFSPSHKAHATCKDRASSRL